MSEWDVGSRFGYGFGYELVYFRLGMLLCFKV